MKISEGENCYLFKGGIIVYCTVVFLFMKLKLTHDKSGCISNLMKNDVRIHLCHELNTVSNNSFILKISFSNKSLNYHAYAGHIYLQLQ